MQELTRLDIASVAKLQGVVMALFGLLAGLLYASFALVAVAVIPGSSPLEGLGVAAIALLGLVGMPVFYGVAGLIMGAVGAWLYNLVAGWIGGIELELADVAAPPVGGFQEPGP